MTQKEYIESVNAAKQHSYEYYVLSRPVISDAEFDALVGRIEQAEQEHPEWTLSGSPTQCVGSDLADNGRRLIRHRTPMLSCQKAQTPDAVQKWCATTEPKLLRVGGGYGYVTEWKMDGISCSLVYQDGQLVSAATRGDKMQGQDILQHVGMMQSVPQRINLCGRVEVRGEVVCPKAELSRLVADYKDCRSAASGLCNQMAPTSDNARLVFVAWEVLADCFDTSETGSMKLAESMGFTCNYRYADDSEALSELLKQYEQERESLPYPTDGVVIKVNNRVAGAALGRTEHHPKSSIAYKFAAQTTETRVCRIEITVGATGRRTPVAWLEPVTILGRRVEKASLGSEAKMQELGVTEGCTVEVGLSNDVTPKIYRVTAAAPHEVSPVEEVVKKPVSAMPMPVTVKVPKGRLNIVISGCFTASAVDGYGREAARRYIVNAGHKVCSELSRKTDYLCIGTANVPGRGVGPSKLQKAKAMGIPVVTLDQLQALLDAA